MLISEIYRIKFVSCFHVQLIDSCIATQNFIF